MNVTVTVLMVLVLFFLPLWCQAQPTDETRDPLTIRMLQVKYVNASLLAEVFGGYTIYGDEVSVLGGGNRGGEVGRARGGNRGANRGGVGGNRGRGGGQRGIGQGRNRSSRR